LLEGLPRPSFGLSWSPRGDLLACGSHDGSVRWWDLTSTDRAGSLPTAGFIPQAKSDTLNVTRDQKEALRRSQNVTTVATSPIGDGCAFGTESGQIWLIETKNSPPREINLPDHLRSSGERAIREIFFSPSKSFIVAIVDQFSENILLVDLRKQKTTFTTYLLGFAIAKDGRRFAALHSVDASNFISIGDISDVVADFADTLAGLRGGYPLHTRSDVICCKWVNNDPNIVVGHADGIISVVEVSSGRIIELEHATRVRSFIQQLPWHVCFLE
jgi:WD40 repeat protein